MSSPTNLTQSAVAPLNPARPFAEALVVDVANSGEVSALLAQLEDDERRISARRARLHERIAFLRATGNADGTPPAPEQLETLDRQEREISRERKELHRRIDELAGRPYRSRSATT